MLFCTTCCCYRRAGVVSTDGDSPAFPPHARASDPSAGLTNCGVARGGKREYHPIKRWCHVLPRATAKGTQPLGLDVGVKNADAGCWCSLRLVFIAAGVHCRWCSLPLVFALPSDGWRCGPARSCAVLRGHRPLSRTLPSFVKSISFRGSVTHFNACSWMLRYFPMDVA
jgi:hypothetical protein